MDQVKREKLLPNDTALNCFLHCMFDMFGLVGTSHILHSIYKA